MADLPSPAGRRATEVERRFGDDVAIASDGDLLVFDWARVWRIGPDGIVRVAAGNGRQRTSPETHNGDGGPAAAAFVDPTAVAALPDGGFLIAERYEGRVRRVTGEGTITTVAGTIPLWSPWSGSEPDRGARGDGGPATAASLEPLALALTPDGGYLVLEPTRVRRVAPDGTITTAAGTGVAGFSGDGGSAVQARIHTFDGDFPGGGGDIAVTADGGFLIADTMNHRIRKVGADGQITTVAGDGRVRTPRDGVPAVRSSLRNPLAVAAMPTGGFRFFELWRRTIREVSADGTITTVIGHGAYTSTTAAVPVGDGGTARDASVAPQGRGLVLTPERGWLFTDFARVRLVTPAMPHRLDAAVTSVNGQARSPVVRVSSTATGVARLTLTTAAGQVAASATQPVTAGDTTIPLSPVNPAPYWLDLAVTDSGGRYTSTRLAVVLGPSLTRSAARHAVEHRLYDEGIPFRVGKCHRVNSRRVDCEAQRARRCTAIHAVTLRNAFTFVRRYRCHAGVRRTPRWLEPAHPWPMLGKPAP